jgi:hypothetical protein
LLLSEDSHDAATQTPDVEPYLLPMANGEVWLFWSSTAGLAARRFQNGVFMNHEIVPNTSSGFGVPNDRQPCAVEEPDGSVRVFWARGPFANGDIVTARRDVTTGLWDQIRLATVGPGDNNSPFALQNGDDVPWLFWSSNRSGTPDLHMKRLFTVV